MLKAGSVHQLSRKEQKSITGGAATCVGVVCTAPGTCCRRGACVIPKPTEAQCISLSPE